MGTRAGEVNCGAPHEFVRGAKWLAAVGATLFFSYLAWAAPARAASPQRVVSVNVCTDEYVFRLLPRARIAALSYLAADRHPVVSTIAEEVAGIPLIHQTAEEVLAAHPDLVVMDQGANARVRAIVAEAGIAIVDVPWANSLAEVRAVARKLAAQLGVPENGEALIAEMDVRLAAARVRAPHPPVNTLLYEPNGYTVAGGITDEIMTASGLVNAAPTMRPTRLGTIPVETVVAAAPELLILDGEPRARDSQATLAQHHPALKALAGRTRMVWLTLTPLLCPGPWAALSAADFVAAARKTRGLAAGVAFE